jgi:hypothetical protein
MIIYPKLILCSVLLIDSNEHINTSNNIINYNIVDYNHFNEDTTDNTKYELITNQKIINDWNTKNSSLKDTQTP